MSMISYHASGHPFTPAIAKWYADYCHRVLTSSGPLLKKGDGLAYQSPSILERSLRPNIEIFLERADDNMRSLPPFPFALMTLFEEHYEVNYRFEERRYRELNSDDWPEGLSLRSLPPIFWDAVTTPEDSSTSSSQEAVKTLESSLDKTISSGEMVLTQMEKLLTSIKGYLAGQKDLESGEVVEPFSRPPTPVPELIYDSTTLRPNAPSFVPGKVGLLAQPLPNRPLESYKRKLARVALV